MALYELVLRQQTNATELINRWNYVSQGSPTGVTGSFALVSAAGGILTGDPAAFPAGEMMALVAAIQASDVIFVELAGINVYEDDDFFTIAYPSGIFGGVAAAGSAQFVASGFRTNRVTRAVRRGFKRFGGVPTGAISEFGALSVGHKASMATLAAKMSETLEYTDGGNSLSYVPTIVSKEKYTTPAGNTAYRYYSTLSAQLDHIAQGVTWEGYSIVRSQASRQLGRGA